MSNPVLGSQATKLLADINVAWSRLKLDEAQKVIADLQDQQKAPDFWDDNERAQNVTKQLARLEQRAKPWQELRQRSNELGSMIELNDASLEIELGDEYEQLSKIYEDLKASLKLAGPYDDHDALLSIHSGAGGTDAQDWAQILLRMYIRYAEARGFLVETVEQSSGETAGIKSVTLNIEGVNAFGLLKSEHGVHRLVRLSPFNADNLRQTSFAKVEIMPKIDAPDEVVIDEKDIKIDVYRSGGHGGQSVNTTDSAVRITHLPTNIVVAIQNERSQLQNKETALTILRSRLAQLQLEQHAQAVSELKGPNQSAEWGNQIRSYVLHPYKQVKDLRTRYESSDPDAILDGKLDEFVDAYLEQQLGVDSPA